LVQIIIQKKDKLISTISFKPISSILFVNENTIEEIFIDDITIEKVGKKAYGLASIPTQWTLPFIVISKDLILKRTDLISKSWISNILKSLNQINIINDEDIIIRSSGCKEGIEERGQLYSCPGNLINIETKLNDCLNKILSDESITDYNIPLIIQRYISAYEEKGHLSNERRLSEHTRDWIAERETNKSQDKHFKIALRNWRESINFEKYLNINLFCNLSSNIKNVLKIPASWSTNLGARLHLEWVWDGQHLYIVQADEDTGEYGINPKNNLPNNNSFEEITTTVLQRINTSHSEKYPKIKNVFIYQKLDLPIAPLYILENKEVLENLSKGIIDKDLSDDIKKLITKPLIIRMDIDSTKQEERQLLPRIEVRDYAGAIQWLEKQCESFLNENAKTSKIVFILHNFIPSVASAFAYATPSGRKVQIASLWGLPEGLYFNSHDKYIVDTKSPSMSKLNIKNFSIDVKKHHKNFFVSADKEGNWHTNILAKPYDWKESIEDREWVKQIALDSRRIAQEEGRALSIMWFVDVPESLCATRVFPWHHEDFDKNIIKKSKKYHYKTPFDKSFTIETVDDIEQLKKESNNGNSSIKRINIQPKEDQLLRSKHLLKDIGELAKKLNAIILLEGSVLSHAYYQLMQTDAIVEIYHPFDDFDDKQEFNKLVRDKVPDNIKEGGETVNVVKLAKSSKLRALKDKLIEEAFEVLDADDDTILSELADVAEVIDGILYQLNITKEELSEVKSRKYDKVGGFQDGKILLETNNPIPTEVESPSVLFTISNTTKNLTEVNYEEVISKTIDKYSDRRILDDTYEDLIRVTVPMIQDEWFTSILELTLDETNKAKLTLSGKRIDASYQIQLSVFTQKDKNTQLQFNFEE